jgi:molybdopterin synthase catalytic subunit
VDANVLIEKIKSHPRYGEVGMILCHNGVVRSTSRDGRIVTGLRVAVDHEKLAAAVAEGKKRPGIVEVLVEIAEDIDLAVGEDVMLLVVAGDIRENVLAALEATLNTIKTAVTSKTEFFVQS